MSFGQSIRQVLSHYADFNGRARRPEFWWFFLFYMLVQFAGGIIDMALFPNSVGVMGTLAALALFLPYLAVSARRLHDTDRSAWWLLIGFIPVIGAIVLLVFLVQSGTDGPNRYGADAAGSTIISA